MLESKPWKQTPDAQVSKWKLCMECPDSVDHILGPTNQEAAMTQVLEGCGHLEII